MRYSTSIPFMLMALVLAGCGDAIKGRSAGCDLSLQMAEATQEPGQPLVLLACPTETESELGSPIRVVVGLANVSNTSVLISASFVFGAWLDATIVGPDGHRLESMEHIDPPRVQAVAIDPGEVVEAIIDLQCPIIGYGPDDCVAPYIFGQPGRYTVHMRYTYPCVDGPCPPGASDVNQLSAEPFTIILR
jgi:hypothetical protein